MNFAEDNSPLTEEFNAAANNPHEYDNAFLKQREASGFANFGFDPAEAAEMRQAEMENQLDRNEVEDDIYEDNTDFNYLDEEEDEDEYDRFSESYGRDFNERDSDNWE